MSRPFQVTFDANDPPALARFWAVALGMIEQPPPPGFESWDEFADDRGIPQEERGKYASVVDPDALRPRVFFQRVPEGKTAKNRVHLDIDAAAGADVDVAARAQLVDEHVARLVAAGATELARHSEFGASWVVMQDPEGNEFCVQ